LAEALDLLEQLGDEARVLAGGQSLIPLMKLRFLSPAHVVDIGRLQELKGIEQRGSEIRCGAMVRHGEMERSNLLQRCLPLLHEASHEIADVQVRNRGTLGGALAQADPAGDWPTACLALGARFLCVSKRGERFIEAEDFFKDTYTTALEPGELLKDVFFPIPPDDGKWAYVKIHRRAGDFAIASTAVQIALNGSNQCKTVGLGLGGVGLTPLAPRNVAEYLTGRTLTDANIEEAGTMLAAQLDPIEDIRGAADYKRRVAKAAFRRAIEKAISRGH
jgi:carbon-monoxide dehydrogenase medium subunit